MVWYLRCFLCLCCLSLSDLCWVVLSHWRPRTLVQWCNACCLFQKRIGLKWWDGPAHNQPSIWFYWSLSTAVLCLFVNPVSNFRFHSHTHRHCPKCSDHFRASNCLKGRNLRGPVRDLCSTENVRSRIEWSWMMTYTKGQWKQQLTMISENDTL